MDQALLRKVLGLKEDATDEQVTSTLTERGIKDGALFLQEDVNHFLAEDKKRVREENAKLLRQIEESKRSQDGLTRRVDELLERFSDDPDKARDGAGAGGGTTGGDGGSAVGNGAVDKETAARLKRLERQIEGHQKELQEAKAQAEAAKQQARTRERDMLLVSAATTSEFIDPQDAIRYFADRMEYDDERRQWRFLDDAGLPAETIQSGLKEASSRRIYLLKPRNAGGGGSGGGSGAGSPVKELEKQLADVKAGLSKDPSNQSLMTQLCALQTKLAQEQKSKAKGS